jgi:hypothetical protein
MHAYAWLFLLTLAGPVENAKLPCTCDFCQHGRAPAVVRSAAGAQGVTENFVVRSYSSAVDATQLARHATALRSRLAQQWLRGSNATDRPWTPRCEIIVHPNLASYLRSVGPSGAATLGSTVVRFNAGQVVMRRIDLLADRPAQPFETVGHELVHVLFAERFPKSSPPRWAEEGAALLVDTEGKRAAHRRDFASSLRDGTAFRVGEMLAMNDYPPPTRFAAFYGQSLVLVDFLMRLGEPEDFARFVDQSMAVGHDRALSEVYGIASAAQLEELWQERAVKSVVAVN